VRACPRADSRANLYAVIDRESGNTMQPSNTDEWRSATYKALAAYDGIDRRDVVLARSSFCTRPCHPNSPSLSD